MKWYSARLSKKRANESPRMSEYQFLGRTLKTSAALAVASSDWLELFIMRRYTPKQLADYVTGWMMVTDDGKNDIEGLKSAIRNAKATLEDPNDGIENYAKRQEQRLAEALKIPYSNGKVRHD